jgi:hypothetical protein
MVLMLLNAAIRTISSKIFEPTTVRIHGGEWTRKTSVPNDNDDRPLPPESRLRP